jgi:hypothetical protein
LRGGGDLNEVPSIVLTPPVDLDTREGFLPETPEYEDLSPIGLRSSSSTAESIVSNSLSNIEASSIPLPTSVEHITPLSPLSPLYLSADIESPPNLLPQTNLDLNRPNLIINTNIPLEVVSGLNTD